MNYYQSHQKLSLPPGEEGSPRRWTADEFEQMVRAGIVDEVERVELIGGEIVQRSSKGNRHEVVRSELMVNWSRRLPLLIKFSMEAPLRLDEHNEPEPDIILFDASRRVYEVNGETVLLVVEISDSSLSYDLKVKAPMYAAFGVREYWVIDPRSLRTVVHRGPSENGHTEVTEAGPNDLVTPLLAPELAVRLADLGIAPEKMA